jgi:hypothetical protein
MATMYILVSSLRLHLTVEAAPLLAVLYQSITWNYPWVGFTSECTSCRDDGVRANKRERQWRPAEWNHVTDHYSIATTVLRRELTGSSRKIAIRPLAGPS